MLEVNLEDEQEVTGVKMGREESLLGQGKNNFTFSRMHQWLSIGEVEN